MSGDPITLTSHRGILADTPMRSLVYVPTNATGRVSALASCVHRSVDRLHAPGSCCSIRSVVSRGRPHPSTSPNPAVSGGQLTPIQRVPQVPEVFVGRGDRSGLLTLGRCTPKYAIASHIRSRAREPRRQQDPHEQGKGNMGYPIRLRDGLGGAFGKARLVEPCP